jgi:hypothetical protein
LLGVLLATVVAVSTAQSRSTADDAVGINGDKINLIEKDDQYSPAKELELVKSSINDDKMPLFLGTSNSRAYASIVPGLTTPRPSASSPRDCRSDLCRSRLHDGSPQTENVRGIALLKSMTKEGLDVPISAPYSLTQPIVWISSPYAAGKNFIGTNCVSPSRYVKAATGKLAYATGKRYGYPDSDTQANWSLGWVQSRVVVQALRNAKGNSTGEGIRKDFEQNPGTCGKAKG